jgi:predicted SprT family Zn-dependent metalloprotease
MFNQTIEISDNYDYTESQLRDILVHEMIHYYLAYKGIDPQCNHGREFNKMADNFNRTYGMNITSTIDLTPYKIKNGNSKLMFTLSTLF